MFKGYLIFQNSDFLECKAKEDHIQENTILKNKVSVLGGVSSLGILIRLLQKRRWLWPA